MGAGCSPPLLPACPDDYEPIESKVEEVSIGIQTDPLPEYDPSSVEIAASADHQPTEIIRNALEDVGDVVEDVQSRLSNVEDVTDEVMEDVTETVVEEAVEDRTTEIIHNIVEDVECRLSNVEDVTDEVMEDVTETVVEEAVEDRPTEIIRNIVEDVAEILEDVECRLSNVEDVKDEVMEDVTETVVEEAVEDRPTEIIHNSLEDVEEIVEDVQCRLSTVEHVRQMDTVVEETEAETQSLAVEEVVPCQQPAMIWSAETSPDPEPEEVQEVQEVQEVKEIKEVKEEHLQSAEVKSCPEPKKKEDVPKNSGKLSINYFKIKSIHSLNCL